MTEKKYHPELSVTQIHLTDDKSAFTSMPEAIKIEPVKPDAIKSETTKSGSINKASPKIILATLNARYFHTSFGLRYLYANLQELQQYCEIKEFIIQTRAIDIVEQILASKPDIVGFGVYIWNIVETTDVVC